MKNKIETFRTWTTNRIQEELVLTRTILESPSYFGVNEHRYAYILASELDRRAMLRDATKSERLAMDRRQIAEVKP